MQALFSYLDAAWLVLLALAPWLLLGTVIAAVLHVWLPPEFIRRQLSGRFGVLKAVAVGVPPPALFLRGHPGRSVAEGKRREPWCRGGISHFYTANRGGLRVGQRVVSRLAVRALQGPERGVARMDRWHADEPNR